MFRLILPAIICLAAPAIAAPKPDCPGDGRGTCYEVTACLGEDRVFTGRTQPSTGLIFEVTGLIDGHIPCTGELMEYSRVLSGKLSVTCDDHTAFQAEYLGDFAPSTHFGRGTGYDESGNAISVRVGTDLPATCPAD